MTILVDELNEYTRGPAYLQGWWCHMMSDIADEEGLTELHRMAHRLGLERRWFQSKNPRFPHYDLRPSKREMAIELGAQEVLSTELVRRCAWVSLPTPESSGSSSSDSSSQELSDSHSE